ncbi:SDR family oxidoreductase [Sphingobium subterraneum]|nr:NAD(P)H-binding protein [Sphingobium subterraneum]
MTGATGFVGAETLRQALDVGHRVTALTRRPQPPRDGVTWAPGALDDAAALDTLVAGADVVLHIAGVVNAPSRAAFEAGNGTGTANVIAAMQRAGVRRLVHVSSLAAREPELADYCWSKALAEEHVQASGLDWTIVRPPAVYGQGDTEFRELFRAASKGVLPVPPQGRASLIQVTDLARALLALCETADPAHIGATYEVDDGTPGGLSHAELAAAFGRAMDRRVRPIPLPRWVLMSFAALDGLARGPAAKLTPDRVRYMCHTDWVADPAKRPPAALWAPQISTDAGLRMAAARYRTQPRSS